MNAAKPSRSSNSLYKMEPILVYEPGNALCDARRSDARQSVSLRCSQTLVYIHEEWLAQFLALSRSIEDTIDDPFHQLYEAYNIEHQVPLYEDKETMPGEWYIDIFSGLSQTRRIESAANYWSK